MRETKDTKIKGNNSSSVRLGWLLKEEQKGLGEVAEMLCLKSSLETFHLCDSAVL